MSEDLSSDEEWYASDRFPVGAKLEMKCWECGKQFQCLERLISHYKSHNVQATCYICQVTFRRMTSLTTHLENAHLPYCKRCNQWFSDVWEFNKHIETHSTTRPSLEETHSHGYVITHQDQNSDNCDNELTDSKQAPPSLSGDYAPQIECSKHVAEDHTYNGSCRSDKSTQILTARQSTDTMSESRPLESVEIKRERPEAVVEHVDYTLREDEESRPLESDEIKRERPEAVVEHVDYTLREDEESRPLESDENTDDSTSSLDNDLEINLGKRERPETVVEYMDCTLREDDVILVTSSDECENTDDSTSSMDKDLEINLGVSDGDETTSDDELAESLQSQSSDDCTEDTGSNSESNSTSSGTSSTNSNIKASMCTLCGKGPFKNVKVHLLHCPGKMQKLQCSVCKEYFATGKSLLKHQLHLYCCDLCGQVFFHWNSYRPHICPKGNKSSSPTILLSCYESMPKQCSMCKAVFSTEQNLLNHAVTAHSSRVSTKVCIITKPSALTVENGSPVVSATEAQLVPSSSGHVLVSNHAVTSQSPSAVNQIMHGKPSLGQSNAWPLSTLVRSSPCSPSPSSSQTRSVQMMARLVNGGTNKFMILQKTPSTVTHATTQNITGSQHPATTLPVKPLAPIFMTVPIAAARQRTDHALGQVSYQPPERRTPSSVPVSATNKTTATVASHSVSPIRAPLNIGTVFKNNSQDVALKKRMNTGWRSKAPYRCRQCGAVARQPSLIVSHRYLHRGRRCHRCQCGRTFLHQLHLLQHCMQHAEATSYICVSCGETLVGAKLLAKHMMCNSKKSLSSGCTSKHRARKKCSMPLSCECGQLFVRPSAYIWHQLKNRAKAKHRKKPSK